MTIWRPSPIIKVKALGLHWRNGRLLAAEVCNDRGDVKGVRPLGGSVEFGETAEAAVIREFREELDLGIRVLGAPHVMENLFHHEGAAGHEVVFLFDVALPPGSFETLETILFHEDDGTAAIARWFDLEELDHKTGPALYPTGLKALLGRRGGVVGA